MLSVVIPVSPVQFTSFYYDIVYIPKRSFVCCVCLLVLYFTSWGVTSVTHAACTQIPASPLTGSEHSYRVVPSALGHYSWWFETDSFPPQSLWSLSLSFCSYLFFFHFLLFTNLFPVSLIYRYKHQGITPWFQSCSCCYGVHTLAWSAVTVVNSYTMMSHLIDMVFVQPHPWRKKSVSFSFKCLLHCSGKKLRGTERYIIYWSCVVWMCLLENEAVRGVQIPSATCTTWY